jgi:hypothetical protein
LYQYLKQYIPKESLIVYFTGKKGFHIECEALSLGINPSNKLPILFRFIANDIKSTLNITSMDFSVYDARRMWRLPGSRHQDTGLYKNRLDENILFSSMKEIVSYCQELQDNTIQEQVFSLDASAWFKKFEYRMEISRQSSNDFLEYFNKKGSAAFKEFALSKKIFTPNELLKNCPSTAKLIDQAKQTHKLEHEARLFLCSLLTYTEDSIKFLYEILSYCDDFNYEKSTSHINDWIKRRQLGIGGRPYTCERANSVGVGCGDCHLEKKKKIILVGTKYINTSEEVSPSPIRFAYKSEKGGKNV